LVKLPIVKIGFIKTAFGLHPQIVDVTHHMSNKSGCITFLYQKNTNILGCYNKSNNTEAATKKGTTPLVNA
jgi:hypothetical protein